MGNVEVKCSREIILSFLQDQNRCMTLNIFPCSIAECFAFLVCTRWSNPLIHRNNYTTEVGPSSMTIGYIDWNNCLAVTPQHQDRICGLQDIGGHIMKVPIIGFQVLLCMRLEVCTLLVVIAGWCW